MSKPRVSVARWSAETIGPTIIAVPHRGHSHVAQGAAAVVDVAVACVGVAAARWRGEQHPRESQAGHAAGIGEKPRLPDAYEAARQDVLDEAA